MAAAKLRVLQCIRQGQVGGGESHLLNLVNHLNRDKFEPVVLSFTEGPMVDSLRAKNVKCFVIETLRPFDVSVWKKVKELMISEKIDLVHAHGTRANSNISWAARSLNIPIVYTIHGWSFHPDQGFLLKKFRTLSEKYLTSRSTLNISVSAANKRSGETEIKGFKSVIVNYGIDQTKFSPSNVQKDVRAELGIPADKTLVVFIARFTLQKQPQAVVKAFGKAVKANPDLHLLMVGDGELKAETVALAQELGITSRITFQSFRLDVPDVLGAADIFVLPSLWEGLPIGLLEAMAMGKAIIASSVDGTPEVIRHDQNGLLVKPGSWEDLGDAIVRLSSDKDMIRTFQERALKTLSEEFNVNNMTLQIEDLYQKICKN